MLAWLEFEEPNAEPGDFVDFLSVTPETPEDIDDAELADWARGLIRRLMQEPDHPLADTPDDETDLRELSREGTLMVHLACLIGDLPTSASSKAATDVASDLLFQASTRLTTEWTKRTHRSTPSGKRGYQFKKHSLALAAFRRTAATLASTIALSTPGNSVKSACPQVVRMVEVSGYKEIDDALDFETPTAETIRHWVKTEYPDKFERGKAVDLYVSEWVDLQFAAFCRQHGGAPAPNAVEAIVGKWRDLIGAYAQAKLKRHIAEAKVELLSW